MEPLRRAWAEIDLDALVNNFNIIKNTTNQKIYAVVKADAYGHGAIQISRALQRAGVFGFAVSNLLEAEELRFAGIDKPILILGYTPVDCAKRLALNNISQCVMSYDYAEQLNFYAKKADVTVTTHLKLDTGMGRIGLDFRNEEDFAFEEAERIFALRNLNTEGVFMHFAVADSEDEDDKKFTSQQYKRFLSAVSQLEKKHPFQIKHCSNSAALLNGIENQETAVRAGIILYGLSPSDNLPVPHGIKPVMSFHSVVSMIKDIEQNETVSYGRTYTAPSQRCIATIPAGYADGMPRLLSNKGYVIIKGKKAPIIGRICMDQFCVDITDIEDVSLGDEVIIFGDGLSVDVLAEIAQTINYEIICGISKRIPRIYKGF
ncbi:MAG: alanine racemase [Clostridia bacterium]|nr:alanine racemase [Clostridia bacterium]MBR3974831.1 alanine racemase [Clostridia bacterium]